METRNLRKNLTGSSSNVILYVERENEPNLDNRKRQGVAPIHAGEPRGFDRRHEPRLRNGSDSDHSGRARRETKPQRTSRNSHKAVCSLETVLTRLTKKGR